MSLIISVYTNEGIVMASDSRSTATITQVLPNGNTASALGVQITDNTYKTFLYDGRIGISTCGAASINNKPITGYIDQFIMQNEEKKYGVHDVSFALLNHFSALGLSEDVHFIVAGYNSSGYKEIEQVQTLGNQINPINTNISGVVWDGETGILTRLVKPVIVNNMNGTYFDLPPYTTNYEFFSLQDAIEYAEYAIEITMKTMKFQNCVKTVGGPIDILVIKPDKAMWIQRKELHA